MAVRSFGLRLRLRPPESHKLVMYCASLASPYAVEAIDAAGVVYLVMFSIDAGALAAAVAASAGVAFVFVDDRTEQGETAEKSECGAHRADDIAPCAAPGPSAYCNYDKCDESHDQEARQYAFTRGEACDCADYPAIGAIWSNQCNKELRADDYRNDCEYKHGISYIPFFLDIAEMLDVRFESALRFLALCLGFLKLVDLNLVEKETSAASDIHYDVLEYAHRAYYRAIDSTEQYGQKQNSADNGEVESQAGWQKL